MHKRLSVAFAFALALLLPGLSKAQVVTVTFTLPALAAKRTGPPVPPEISEDPRLRVAVGQVREATGGFVTTATDAATRFVAAIEGNSQVVVRAMDGSSADVVLRPPAAMADETFISSVAMARDGSTVAVAWASDKSAAIFLFDRASGAIVGRIDGPVDVVSDMRFSPDGQMIAAAISSGGVQTFNLRTHAEIGRDLNYDGRGYSVDISPDGRLMVTTCSDRVVRLYQLQGGSPHLLGGSIGGSNVFKTAPSSARFSPDGHIIAMGFDRGPGVEMWSPDTLKKAEMLNDLGMLSNASVVAWSPDGKQVYAPSSNAKGDFKIRIWTSSRSVDAGDEGFNSLAKHQDLHADGHGTARAFVPLEGGRLLVITSSGAWGLFDQQGNLTWIVEPRPVRFAGLVFDISKPFPLLLSADGKTVQFPYDGYTNLGAFDTSLLGLVTAPPGLAPALTKNAFKLDVNITGIFGVSDPTKRATLNGAPLPLAPKEFATGYAVSPDGQVIAMSTSTAVRMFSRSGALLWSRPGGGGSTTSSVNISRDGRLVVVDNGVIRWFRASDGTLMLNLLVSADRTRWVAWTPSGYYQASPNGDDMVEWLVNRGLNQPADVFPLSRFEDVMRRPDIVGRVLDTLDESAAVDQANLAAGRKPVRLADLAKPVVQPVSAPQPKPAAKGSQAVKGRPAPRVEPATRAPAPPAPQRQEVLETTRVSAKLVAKILPPVLDVVSPPTSFSTDSVIIRYRVRTPEDAPMIGEPRVLLNGVWQPHSRAVGQVAADIHTLVVSGMPQRDSVIEIYADNRNGASAPMPVKLRWAGSATTPAKAVSAPARKPRLFVLAIGVSQYAKAELHLDFADRDAEQLSAAMVGQQGRAYASVTTKLLLNGQATQAGVAAGLQWLQSQLAADDVGLLFLAGHGFNSSDGYYFFAPADFDPARPRETGVDYKSIRDALVRFAGKGNRTIFLIDTCYSGSALGANNTASSGESFGSSLVSAQFSMVGMTSSSRQQVSLEKAEWGDGAFTKAIVEGIAQGRADPAQSGEITMLGLGNYVSARVKVLTDRAQTPIFMAPSGLQDFAIATDVSIAR